MIIFNVAYPALKFEKYVKIKNILDLPGGFFSFVVAEAKEEYLTW